MTASAPNHGDVPPTLQSPRLVVVSAGVSDPSSTRMLADRITRSSLDLLRESGMPATAHVIELRPLAVDIAHATIAGFPEEQLQSAIERLAAADAVIVATPVYKAGVSGLFKSFVDVLDDDLLLAKPVLLAATAGSARHALVVDDQMRPLFAYMRAFVIPTSVFAAPEDWRATELGERINRAAAELTVMLSARAEQQITERSWPATSTHSPATPPAPDAAPTTSTSTPPSCDSPPAEAGADRRARDARGASGAGIWM